LANGLLRLTGLTFPFDLREKVTVVSPFFLKRPLLSQIFALLLAFCVFTGFARSSLESRPRWLREGVYARYEFPSGGITFSNGTWKHVNFEAALQWECVDLEGGVAKLNISLYLNETLLSALVYVDLTSRDVTLPNGTYLGKTMLWLPANPAQDKLFELNKNQTARVQIRTQTDTCQGLQRYFEAEGEDLSIGGSYDLDTGVLIWTDWEYEPELLAFDIVDVGYHGSSGITATNIDLGPREWLFEILRNIPFILPIVGFALVSIFLYRRRRLKKRQRKQLPTKNQCNQTRFMWTAQSRSRRKQVARKYASKTLTTKLVMFSIFARASINLYTI
jgi:hypothetical protein